MDPYIKIDEHKGSAWLEAHGEIQTYAGDRGTKICLSMEMTPEQLKEVISRMIKTYRKLTKTKAYNDMNFTPNPKPYRERLKRNSVAWKNRVLELFERDNYTCYWCGRVFTYEYLAPCHIKSTGAGGGDDLENLRTGCKEDHGKDHNGDFLK